MEIKNYIDKLIDRANKIDGIQWEAYYVSGSSFMVMVNDQQVQEYNVDSTCGLSFRVLHDGKMGYSYTQYFGEESIDTLIEQAIDNSKIITSDDMQFIYAGDDKYPELDIYNHKIDNVPAERKIELALEIERKCKEKSDLIKSVGYCLVQTSASEEIITNSNGMNLSFKMNSASAYAMPVATKGDVSYNGFDILIIKDFDNVDVDALVDNAVEKALCQFGAKQVPTGKYDVVFDYDSSSDLLGTFCSMFSSESAQKGLSLLAGKEGEVIASDIVNIVDNPLLIDGLNSAPFDAEGVAAEKTIVVENGKLNTLLYNLKTAYKANAKSTGNASKGGYNSPIGISPTNFYIEPMDNTVEDLYLKVGDGLLITSLDGLHAANPVSCDFSLSAKGFVIRDGKKAEPVEQITVSGNYYALLKSITMIANDFKYGDIQKSSVASPSILVEQLDVAGL